MKLRDRHLSDAATAAVLADMMRDSLVILDGQDGGSQWHVVGLADANVRLPLRLDADSVRNVVDMGVLGTDRDAWLSDRLIEAGYGPETLDLSRYRGPLIAQAFTDAAATSSTCADLSALLVTAKRQVDTAAEALCPEHDALESGLLDVTFGVLAMLDGMVPTSETVAHAARALAAYADAAGRQAVARYARHRLVEQADAERARDAAVDVTREAAILAIAESLHNFVTAERPGQQNVVARYLVERGGLRTRELGEAYSCTRQAAETYVRDIHKAPRLHGQRAQHFMRVVREHRDKHLRLAHDLERVLDGSIRDV